MSTTRAKIRQIRTVVWCAASCVALSTCAGGASVADGPAVQDTTTTTGSTTEPLPSETESSETQTADSADEASAVAVEDALDLGNLVVMGEEVLLADVLSLGLEPMAAAATVPDVGFQGLDQYDTSTIEILGITTLSLEHLASLKPDTIITYEFWQQQVGEDVLSELADNILILPNGLSTSDRIAEVGRLLQREERAAEIQAELATATELAAAAISDCEVSLAVVYPGPTVAAFVDAVWEIPVSITNVGCKLVPSSDDIGADRNGRAWISEEQLGLLSGETLIMLQTDAVGGERTSLNEIKEHPLWKQLPAVQAGTVYEFDRLGYPGAAGQIRFLQEFVTLLGS